VFDRYHKVRKEMVNVSGVGRYTKASMTRTMLIESKAICSSEK
jgi:hypothetical protein